MKILIIDDEPDLRSLVSIVLENSLGIPTILAESKLKAIETLSHDSDIKGIICDFQMPDGNGAELLKFLKDQNLKIPVILCSGTPLELNPELSNYPATHFILKPFTKDEILAKVRKVFALAEGPT